MLGPKDHEKYQQINNAAVKFCDAIEQMTGHRPFVMWAIVGEKPGVIAGQASGERSFALDELGAMYMAMIRMMSEDFGNAFCDKHHNHQ